MLFIKRKYLFFVLCVLSFKATLFAQSKKIKSIKADFLIKTQESVQEQESFSLEQGSFSFSYEPFYFELKTELPEQKTSYLDESSFSKDFNQASTMMKTCSYLVSWFTDDYGLFDSEMENVQYSVNSAGQVQKEWTGIENSTQIKITATYDDNMNVFRIETDGNKTNGDRLTSSIDISSFYFSNGFFFPASIHIKTFEHQALTSCTDLEFKNINASMALEKSSYAINPNTKKEKTKNTGDSDTSFYSVPAVGAQAAFSLYKKFITKQDASSCRFTPSCSQFMLAAIRKNEFFGIIQGIERLERCTKFEHRRGLYLQDEHGLHIDEVPALK